MATLRDSISDYRELNEPLRRSMQRWWKGPGRLWILATILPSLVLFLLQMILRGHQPRTMQWNALEFVSPLLVISGQLLPILGWYFAGSQRISLLGDLRRDTVMHASPALRRFALSSSLLAGWPIPLALLLAGLLVLLLQMMFIYRGVPGHVFVLDSLQQLSGMLIYAGSLVCIALAYRETTDRTLAGLLLLLVMQLHVILIPLDIFARLFQTLQQVELLSTCQPALIGLGIIAAVGMLAILLLASNASGIQRWLPLAVLFCMRLYESLVDLQHSRFNNAYIGNPVVEFLHGFQMVMKRLPASYEMHTFYYADHAEGAMALRWIWNHALAVKMGNEGYLLALLANLLWLAVVFLFCRWAVGRSAVREE